MIHMEVSSYFCNVCSFLFVQWGNIQQQGRPNKLNGYDNEKQMCLYSSYLLYGNSKSVVAVCLVIDWTHKLKQMCSLCYVQSLSVISHKFSGFESGYDHGLLIDIKTSDPVSNVIRTHH